MDKPCVGYKKKMQYLKIFHNTQNHLESPHTHYLGNATPFARMWTAVQKMGQRYTENGELILKQKKGDVVGGPSLPFSNQNYSEKICYLSKRSLFVTGYLNFRKYR